MTKTYAEQAKEQVEALFDGESTRNASYKAGFNACRLKVLTILAAQPTLPSAIDACTACGGTGKEPLPSQPPAPEPGKDLVERAKQQLECNFATGPFKGDQTHTIFWNVLIDREKDALATFVAKVWRDAKVWGRDWAIEQFLATRRKEGHFHKGFMHCPLCEIEKEIAAIRALIPGEQPAHEDKTGGGK